MEEAKPVVLTKPVRGREMLSKKGPLHKVAPAGAIEPEKVDKKRVETYYEGYVDGQLFLVPDSNLEAMKDMINFKMRPKTSIRYKHQTSYDIQYYDQFTEKLNELLSKIDDFQESGDFERVTSIERESSEESSEDREETEQDEELRDIIPSEEKMEDKEVTTSKEKVESKESVKSKKENIESDESLKSKVLQLESEIIKELEKEYVLEDSSTSSSSSSATYKLSEKLSEPEREIQNEIYEETETESVTDEHRIRFLISGHFKDGENPLYIVQDYDGKNDIFKDQKLDFTSIQENGIANVFISGKLYTENVLEESAGKPMILNTKPEKIIINEEKSKIFNDSFEHVFEKEDYRILLQGKFIKGKNNKITPSLSFCVKEKSTSLNSESDKEESLQKQ